MYPLLHVVTYMTRVDYNALFTPLIAKACVVQWIECRSPDLGVDVRVRITATLDTFLFIEKLTEYFQTYIFSLNFLCVFFVSSQVNACISDFDLLIT